MSLAYASCWTVAGGDSESGDGRRNGTSGQGAINSRKRFGNK